VVEANRERQPIPEGWALGPDGAPTIDAALALQGAMLAMAGHKGIGLAMLVECLAGALAEPPPVAPAAPAGSTVSAGGVSAFLLVVNPDLFVGRAGFDAAMGRWLQHYLRAAGPDARYPGQRQAACEAERSRAGIPLATGLLAELQRTGERVAVPFPPRRPAIREPG